MKIARRFIAGNEGSRKHLSSPMGPKVLILWGPSGTKNCIFVLRSPGNELPGYYRGAPPGLKVSKSLVILTLMGARGALKSVLGNFFESSNA